MIVEEADADMRAYAQEELDKLELRAKAVEEELRVMLLPKDPNDEKNVMLEIRAGTGGDEATLFAAEMFRMYSRFAETQRWKVEVLSTIGVQRRRPEGSDRPHRAASGSIHRLKYESGVHRVQRVPQPRPRGEFTPRQLRWRCCRRRRKLKSRSKRRISASIRFARPAPAGSR